MVWVTGGAEVQQMLFFKIFFPVGGFSTGILSALGENKVKDSIRDIYEMEE